MESRPGFLGSTHHCCLLRESAHRNSPENRSPAGDLHTKELAMEVLYSRCAGLDVHKKTVVACRIYTPESGRKPYGR